MEKIENIRTNIRMSNSKNSYIFISPVGMVVVDDVVRKFIDTFEFQALREKAQLGNCKYVFPSGSHFRAEHSFGVMEITRRIFEVISKARNFDNEFVKYRTYLLIGALYHDIGHGPYSHVFDEYLKGKGVRNTHEMRSVMILKRVNKRLGVFGEDEIEIISNIILGEYLKGHPPFVFEIVNGKQIGGFDADKLDYIPRDQHKVGMSMRSIDYIIANMTLDRDLHIAFYLKAYNEIEMLFKDRKHMYATVYYHEAVKDIDKLLICALYDSGIAEMMSGNESEYMDQFLQLNDHTIKNYISKDHDYSRLYERNFKHKCDKCPPKLIRVAKLSGDTDGNPMDYIRFIE
jgi:HD superfamily phosphohydrolase